MVGGFCLGYWRIIFLKLMIKFYESWDWHRKRDED